MKLNLPDSLYSICSDALNVPIPQLKNPDFWQNVEITQDHIFSAYLIGTYEAIHSRSDSNLIATCLQFATKDKDFLEAYINNGYWNFQNRKFNKTIEMYKHALDLDPPYDSLIMLCMGYVYRLAGDPDQSLKAYTLLKAKYPWFAAGYNNKGCLYASINKDKKALTALTIAIRKDRLLLDALCNRGLVYLKLKKYRNAFDDFTTAIQLNPTFADAYYFRGFARKAMGDISGSVIDYTKAIDLKK